MNRRIGLRRLRARRTANPKDDSRDAERTGNGDCGNHDTGESKTFKTNIGTSVVVNGKADKLASLSVGMHAKFAVFGDGILTRIDAKTTTHGTAAAGAGKHKKK